jgi:DNA-binding transcriptional ArsR family regulator
MNALTFSALADPNRLNIVELLHDGPLSVGEIADRLGLGQPQASKHLRVLSEAGLVEVQPIANRRIYKLRPQSLIELDAWLKPLLHVWDERADRLDDYLQELQGKEKKQSDNI